MDENEKDIIQSLTEEQIQKIHLKVGVTEDSVRDVISFMNTNGLIASGLIDMTPDVVIGFILCELSAQ